MTRFAFFALRCVRIEAVAAFLDGGLLRAKRFAMVVTPPQPRIPPVLLFSIKK
ncbi:hypothetical protein [Pseudomonas protegens]|uniref:hypothetical protein n=1 Tax=Pseudomonas protegens TaxID=380021 RepID=UPI0015E6A875|nr:hypothetical protein [Pseudomonas protegens]